jgi:predicted DCC family thiol-disulfide oxidoreductase YuxK
MPVTENTIIYDGDCIFCRNYVRLLKLRETMGGVTLLNARETGKVSELGFEPESLNDGMIIIFDGKVYKGADAVHRMALLTTSNSFFNRLNRVVFRHRVLAVALYPFLRLGRRLWLLIDGKDLIR